MTKTAMEKVSFLLSGENRSSEYLLGFLMGRNPELFKFSDMKSMSSEMVAGYTISDNYRNRCDNLFRAIRKNKKESPHT